MTQTNQRLLQTTSVSQARVQLYQPTRRPRDCSRIVRTAWGDGTVTGKLGQGHADFVEAVLFHADKLRHLDSGQFQVRVDPYRVRVSMGGGKKSNYEQMWAVATDVQRAVIRLSVTLRKSQPPLRIQGGIIDLIAESPTRVADRWGGDRPLMVVTFNCAYSQLLAEDLPLDYDPAPFARLATGIAQAVARHVRTHSRAPSLGWNMDELIRAVGGGGSMTNRRRELRAEADGLKNLGVLISGNRILRGQHVANDPSRVANDPLRVANDPHV
jgi:hypothetical protein